MQMSHCTLLESSGVIPIPSPSSGMGLGLCRIASMQVITTRQASELTGLSTAKLREWTSRRALIPADVRPKSQGSPVKYTWQTILVLRIAVVLRYRFHLELQAHRHVFGSLRKTLRGTSFVTLWGKSFAIRGSERRGFRNSIDPTPLEEDMLLTNLDPHLQILSVGFALPKPSNMPGQPDLFPARAVPDEGKIGQEENPTVGRSVHEASPRRYA